jgi:hypothetical protein
MPLKLRISSRLATWLRSLIPPAIELRLAGLLPKFKRQKTLGQLVLQLFPPNMSAGLRGILPRRLSAAEKVEARRAEQVRREEQKHEDGLAREANRYVARIVRALDNKGLCYKFERKGKHKVQSVKFCRPYLLSDDMISIKVKPDQLPFEVGYEHFDDYVINILSSNCERSILRYQDQVRGLWLSIEREVGAGGIPLHVRYEEIQERRPPSMVQNSFSIPLGVGEGKRDRWLNIRSENILICGSPRTGKSTLLKMFITSLFMQNPPWRAQFILIDLKAGLTFSIFRDLPHLLRLGEMGISLVDHRRDVIETLQHVEKISEHRMKLLKDASVETFGQYNRKLHGAAAPLSHLFVIIDEWADVQLDKGISGRSNELLMSITNRSLACGVFVVLATQTPQSEVLTQRVRNAFQLRIVFGLADPYMSRALVGSDAALTLRNAGRALVVNGLEKFETQTPYIGDEQLAQYILQAQGAPTEPVKKQTHDVTDQEIYRWALEINQGFLSSDALYLWFKSRGLSKKFAEDFAREREGQRVMVDDVEYEVAKPSGKLPNPRARRLLPVVSVASP